MGDILIIYFTLFSISKILSFQHIINVKKYFPFYAASSNCSVYFTLNWHISIWRDHISSGSSHRWQVVAVLHSPGLDHLCQW